MSLSLATVVLHDTCYIRLSKKVEEEFQKMTRARPGCIKRLIYIIAEKLS